MRMRFQSRGRTPRLPTQRAPTCMALIGNTGGRNIGAGARAGSPPQGRTRMHQLGAPLATGAVNRGKGTGANFSGCNPKSYKGKSAK